VQRMAESPGLVSLLLSHGLEEVVATVLLLLAPEDLKACRRVCRTWNTLILGRLWGTRAGRRALQVKARNRWRTSKATTMELGKARSQIHSIHCDDRFIYCGQENQVNDSRMLLSS